MRLDIVTAAAQGGARVTVVAPRLHGTILLSAFLALWRPIRLLFTMPVLMLELPTKDSNNNGGCVRRACSPPDECLIANETSGTAVNVCHWASIWSSMFKMSASRNQAVLAAGKCSNAIIP